MSFPLSRGGQKRSGTMPFRKLLSTSLILMLFFAGPFARASDPKISELSRKKVGELHYPQVQFVDLKNGMRVYLLEDHDLPILQMYAYIRGGGLQDPPDRVGLASLLGG